MDYKEREFCMKNSKSLLPYLLKKLLRLASLLVALCIVTFVLMEKSPIDPVQLMLEQYKSELRTKRKYSRALGIK